ncbi:hypothetical protein E2562_020247 [Oryza meyeriana var. granulata]|uniref:CCHC-type domain-containing protein n=1 Tax=Oryza meyeriana var. granulata TaxID=110450 RepID=A0A6G1DKF7_9ORYZ|nr:hypothetical protein E2562_020247 [Oryza meyeriana var. granulata]
MASNKCYNCGRLGHWAKDCDSPRRRLTWPKEMTTMMTCCYSHGPAGMKMMTSHCLWPRSDFAIEYHVEQTTGYPVPGSGGDAIPPSTTSTPAQENAAPPSPATPTPAERAATTEFVSPPSHDEERLDAVHSDTPVRYHNVDTLIEEDALGPGLAQQELEEASLLLAGPGEPCSLLKQNVMRHGVPRCKKRWTR